VIATGNAEKAALLVLAMLPDGEAPTEDSIRTNVGLVLSMLQQAGQGEGIDEAQLVRHIESLCNIFVPTAVALEDHRDHHEWLPGRRAEIEWRFWDRYKRYLQETMRLAVCRREHIFQEIVHWETVLKPRNGLQTRFCPPAV